MKAAPEFVAKPWQWPNILSLDAPLIAVLWQLLLAQSLGLHLNRMEPLVLALSVWFVYIADQLLDALRPDSGAWHPGRKIFYRHYFRVASALGFSLAVVMLPLAYWLLRPATFQSGLEMAVPVIVYFGIIHAAPAHWRGFWPREAAVGLLFAMGTFLAVWLAAGKRSAALAAPLLLFALLCWANSAAIETWEWQLAGEPGGGSPSAATRWTGQHLGATAVGIVLAALAARLTGAAPLEFVLACVASGAALAILARFRSRLPPDAVCATLNLALCTPVLALVLQ